MTIGIGSSIPKFIDPATGVVLLDPTTGDVRPIPASQMRFPAEFQDVPLDWAAKIISMAGVRDDGCTSEIWQECVKKAQKETMASWSKEPLILGMMQQKFMELFPGKVAPTTSEEFLKLIPAEAALVYRAVADPIQRVKDENLVRLFEKLPLKTKPALPQDIHLRAGAIRAWMQKNPEALATIQSLYLGLGSLTMLPPEIGLLSNLRKLDLFGNKIQALPREIGLLKNLEELKCRACAFEGLPPEIGQLTQLRILDLTQNQLSTLPIEIGQCIHLTELDLARNNFSVLPEVIFSLRKLEELNVFSNQITTIPDGIKNLGNLRILTCSNNQLEAIPHEIGFLTKLTDLNLNKNRLQDLPSEMRFLENLEYLHLDDNQLTDFPLAICQCRKLRMLMLSENQLEVIPEAIGNLVELRQLNLGTNGKLIGIQDGVQIKSGIQKKLPSGIRFLVNLVALYLQNNQFKELTGEIGHLKELRALHLSHNNLQELPREIAQLNLATLSIDHNPALMAFPKGYVPPAGTDLTGTGMEPPAPPEPLPEEGEDDDVPPLVAPEPALDVEGE